MSNRVIYNVEYNIPRVNLSLPGRQNRGSTNILRFTPGMDEIVEFNFGNMDGVPINLIPFSVKFVVWRRDSLDVADFSVGQSEIVFSKQADVPDPYGGKAVVIFSSQDTQQMAEEGTSGLRWSLFMINDEGNVFPSQVQTNGKRYGQLMLDMESGMPIAELIKNS